MTAHNWEIGFTNKIYYALTFMKIILNYESK
jgi:hypothetical protein